MCFTPFTFDLHSGELWRQGEPVPLQPQPARLLALLVEYRGELLDRDTIRRHLWGEDEVDAEAGVNYAVRQIRKALGDRAESPLYLETVARRGYRFIAPLEPEAATESAPTPPPPPLTGRSWGRSTALGFLGILAVALIAFGRPEHLLGSRDTPPTVDAARDAHLRGLYLLEKGDAESRNRAADFFRQALELDPEMAAAYAALEAASRDTLPPEERLGLLEQALELDPELPEAHLGLGWLELTNLRAAPALDSFYRAMGPGEENLEALHGALLCHSALGQLERAEELIERALRLAPGDTAIRGDAPLVYFWLGKPHLGVLHSERALELEPGRQDIRWTAISYMAHAGRFREAAEQVHLYRGLEQPFDPTADPASFRATVDRFFKGSADRCRNAPQEQPNGGCLAVTGVLLGDVEQALDGLEKAAEEGWYGLPYLGVDPRWDLVRDSPRWRALLAKLGVQDHRRG